MEYQFSKVGGAIQSPESERDLIYERLAFGGNDDLKLLPEEINWSQYANAARNQGKRGTCAAFAGCAIKEIHSNVATGKKEYLSSEFVYYHRNNKPAQGMYGRDAFQILKDIGTVPESMFPYNTECEPDENLYSIASGYRVSDFAKIITMEGLKKALFEVGPCYLVLPLYKTRPQFWKPAGNEKDRGGHAVVVVGYNKDGFLLLNSWGHDWNDNGYVILPYEDWKVSWECWVSLGNSGSSPQRERRKSKSSRSSKSRSFSSASCSKSPGALSSANLNISSGQLMQSMEVVRMNLAEITVYDNNETAPNFIFEDDTNHPQKTKCTIPNKNSDKRKYVTSSDDTKTEPNERAKSTKYVNVSLENTESDSYDGSRPRRKTQVCALF
jgi:hypothetical protein